MGRSTGRRDGLSEQRKYRSWTAQQKLEIVLAGLRGDRSVKELCRQHAIAETLYYAWREKLLEGGREALAGKEERRGERELKRRCLAKWLSQIHNREPACGWASPWMTTPRSAANSRSAGC